MRSISPVWKAVAAGGLVGLAACGSEGGSEGTGGALARVQGEVRGAQHFEGLENPNVGLMWFSFDEEGGTPAVVEVAPLTGSGSAGSFVLPVFAPPPADLVQVFDFDGDGRVDMRMAFGAFFGFEDVNGDGAVAIREDGVEAPDRLFGYAWQDMLVYIAEIESGAAGFFANPEAARPGFHVLHTDVCGYGSELRPLSAPVSLFTFEPSSTVPDEGPYDDVECPWELEPGQCANEDWDTCVETNCRSRVDALVDCLERQCGDGAPCDWDRCAAEVEAIETCVESCGGWSGCGDF